MERKYCGKCEKWYYPNQDWIHAKCKKASDSGISSEQRVAEQPQTDNGAARNSMSVGPEDAFGEISGAKQRWSRKAYNAYMREYMRRRRNA